MNTFAIRIKPDGSLVLLYDDALQPILADLGRPTIRRASHVEPTSDGRWLADLAPAGGPGLGPYPLRSQALDAEREWINVHILGLGQPQASHGGDEDTMTNDDTSSVALHGSSEPSLPHVDAPGVDRDARGRLTEAPRLEAGA